MDSLILIGFICIILALCSVWIYYILDYEHGVLLCTFGVLLTAGIIILIIVGINITPTKQDVLDGKAIYEETIIINKDDTIKTYEIVWKE